MNGKTNVTVSGGNDSLGGIIPLNPPTAFVVTADNAKCLLTWTDPLDKYADDLGQITDEGDQLVSQFAFTRIVRKEGGYPGTPDDGITVTESSVRNQYQSSVYTDEGLTNNTTYYYAAFTCNTDGVWSGSITESATPVAYDPILGNNTWEQVNDVVNQGIYQSLWEIGDEINITYNGSPLAVAICDFNHDDRSDSSGKAAITFSTKELTNETIKDEFGERWSEDNSYSYLQNTVYNNISENTRQYIVKVNKQSGVACTFGWIRGPYKDSATTFLFAPSEVIGSSWNPAPDHYNGDGPQYPYFTTVSNRVKRTDNGNGGNHDWMLRSHSVTIVGIDNRYNSYHITTSGSLGTWSTISPEYNRGVCFGFCIGKASA